MLFEKPKDKVHILAKTPFEVLPCGSSQRRLKFTETDAPTKGKAIYHPESKNLVYLLQRKFYIRNICSIKAKSF